jgi:hypothetical protein
MAAKFACHALFFYAVTRFVLDGSEIADRLYNSHLHYRGRSALRIAVPPPRSNSTHLTHDFSIH